MKAELLQSTAVTSLLPLLPPREVVSHLTLEGGRTMTIRHPEGVKFWECNGHTFMWLDSIQ